MIKEINSEMQLFSVFSCPFSLSSSSLIFSFFFTQFCHFPFLSPPAPPPHTHTHTHIVFNNSFTYGTCSYLRRSLLKSPQINTCLFVFYFLWVLLQFQEIFHLMIFQCVGSRHQSGYLLVFLCRSQSSMIEIHCFQQISSYQGPFLV